MKLFEATYKDGFDYYERYFCTDSNQSKTAKITCGNEYYVPDSRGIYTYLLDDNIRLSKKSGKCTENITYGKLTPDIVRIRDKYWDKTKSKYNYNPRKWYIDIETTAYNKIDVEQVKEELVLVQIFDNITNTMIILGSRPWVNQAKYSYDFECKYLNCENEVKLFETFFALIKKMQPLIVLGWNTNGFDYPFLYNRAKKLGFDTNQFSPYNKSKLSTIITDQGMKSYKLEADGVFYLDYLEVYKKYTYTPRASYSLDNISYVELNERKVNHNMYSTFDGFRTGESYIFPDKAPTDEFDLEMFNLQVLYKETQDNKIKEKIADLANDLFVHYGCIDTYLVKKLDDKLMLSNILINIASKMGVNIPDSLGTVKPWSSYITNIAYLENKILPNSDVDDNADTSIKGGYVAEPVVGKHKWIISVDINSAYPNLSMRGFNMSAETYVAPRDLPADMRDINLAYFNDEDEEKRFKMYLERPEIFNTYTALAKKYNYCLGINGAVFKRDSVGIIPRLVKEIYAERKALKKEMLKWKQEAEKHEHDSEEYKHAKYMEAQCNTGQMVSKVLINSLYGALGNKYFKLFNVNIARAITANTRFYIHLLNYRLNSYLKEKTGVVNSVLYNDTDSIYLSLNSVIEQFYQGEDDVIAKTEFLDKFIKEELDPVIEGGNSELSDILNALEGEAIQAEREAIADVGVMLSKKKYYMRVFDLEGVRYSKDEPYMKKMGLEIIKSSTPKFVKDYLSQSINTILDSDSDDMYNWLESIKGKFTEEPITNISKTTSVSKINYHQGEKGVPINSRAAIAHNNYISSRPELSSKYAAINAGDKMKIVYLKPNNPIGENVVGFIDDSFIELLREHIDYDTCWDKYMISPLNIMINPLGWDMNKRTSTLDDW